MPDWADGEPLETIHVGSPETDESASASETARHGIHVLNMTPDETVVSVTVRSGEQTHVDRQIRMPGESELTIRLHSEAAYVLEIRLPEAGSERTIEIPWKFLDCTHSRHVIWLFRGGAIRSRWTKPDETC